jgi:hypothetical protein
MLSPIGVGIITARDHCLSLVDRHHSYRVFFQLQIRKSAIAPVCVLPSPALLHPLISIEMCRVTIRTRHCGVSYFVVSFCPNAPRINGRRRRCGQTNTSGTVTGSWCRRGCSGEGVISGAPPITARRNIGN